MMNAQDLEKAFSCFNALNAFYIKNKHLILSANERNNQIYEFIMSNISSFEEKELIDPVLDWDNNDAISFQKYKIIDVPNYGKIRLKFFKELKINKPYFNIRQSSYARASNAPVQGKLAPNKDIDKDIELLGFNTLEIAYALLKKHSNNLEKYVYNDSFLWKTIKKLIMCKT